MSEPQGSIGVDNAIQGRVLQQAKTSPLLKALGAASLAVVVIGFLVAPAQLRNYGLVLVCLWAIYAICVQGLNLMLGYAGQVSLAQAAFMGLGAYISTLLVKNAGVNFWLALLIAVVTCTLIGALIGFPALRIKSHYLAFVTLGFNILVTLVLRNEDWLTGGNLGIQNISRPSLFGFALDTNFRYYYFCLAMLALVTLAVWFMLRSPWGRAFKTLRDNPARAESLGISIVSYTLLAFALGSGIAGIAGAVYAPLIEYIEPAAFELPRSLLFLLMLIVGGRGSLAGPFIGAFLVTLLPEWLRVTENYYLVLFSLAVMALMLFFPQGIAGLAKKVSDFFMKSDI
jgi:branched-chain amino acid transport system permease protein